MENLSDCEVCFFLCAGDVMAARVGWNPAGGSKSLPDGSVHKGRGTRQLHDGGLLPWLSSAQFTKVAQPSAGQGPACTADSCRAKVRDVRVAVLDAHVKFKNELIWSI